MTDEPDDPQDDELEEGDDEALSDTHTLALGDDELPLGHPPEAIPRGATLGQYVILGQISSGGTGIVYAAFDPSRDRKIALKLLPIDDEDPDEAVRRRREVIERIEATAKIDHPCVIETYDVTAYDGGVMVAMEFIDGINLRQWMEARDDPFPWPEVLRVFREAGAGLAAAHAAGVVHGDFKPDNVLLAKKGRICILDFGLATEIPDEDPELEPKIDLVELKDALPAILSTHEDSLPDLTEMGPVMGTPAYMAPERHVGAAGDQKTDQFSFCVAFYEALYGERPYRGSRRATLAEETIHNRVRDAPEGSEVPEWLRAVLLRGLQPRRADRYPSMGALLQDLDHDPVASRRRWMVGLGAMGALGAAAAGVAYFLYFESERCEATEDELAGVWDAGTRADLRSVIEGSGRPHAYDTWRAVEARIDDWMTKWVGLHEQACAATRIRREASEQLLLRRYACLDARLDEVAAFERVYTTTATPVMIDNAQRVVDSIPLPNDCISMETLETHADAPAAIHDVIEDLEQREREAWVAWMAGNIPAAQGSADAVREGLEGADFAPLHVHNTMVRGLIERAEGRELEAERLLHEAAARASAEGLQQLAAEAWLRLLETTAADPKRTRETAVWAEYAAETIERLGDDRLRARLLRAQGDIARARGKAGDALSLYHRGLTLLERSNVPPSVQAEALEQLGRIVEERGEYVSAGQYYERAVDLRQQQLGPLHPALASALAALGRARLAQDPPRYDDAYPPLERAREIADANAMGASVIAPLDVEMGEIELLRSRAQAAAEHFARAADMLEAELGQAPLRAEALIGLGQTQLERGQLDQARASLEQALEVLGDDASDPLSRGRAHELLALILAEDDERRAALEHAGAAIDHYLSAGDAGTTHHERVNQWLESRQPKPSPPESP
jgi:tRNA A-37 threonylcarbamoyl transferase component Bud32/tetratricopeptide (TPR) repeat protein